ncbi:MAG: 2-succinyl-5-enolpyruvyl-6-hydroxy-3-cyclohexene-carboxylate synthase, partial [Thermoleophilaceae bacterium]|nr:2-succinyl-5-enolpyruvyl-6-hydroxy-3-cyclohexene-carboxylate synthase [Thermoleophilaceae bacterium]
MDWHDPTRTAESIWRVTADELYGLLPQREGVRPPSHPDRGREGSDPYLAAWVAGDRVVADELARVEEPFEPLAYNVLAETAEIIWVSSSLPIRDVESYFPATERPIRLLSNRGANGIDGVVSSAAGASIAANTPVHLIIGELALLHDVGGLVSARRAGAELAVLCVNNGGGGIFDFLPVAEQAEAADYEAHIATPVEFDLAAAAALGGLEHHVVQDAAGVREHLEPGTLVELRVDRATSLTRHRDLASRIVARLESP